MDTSFTSITFPDDYRKKIRQMKQAMREQIGDVEGLFKQICDKIEQELSAVREDEKNAGSAWPEIHWRDLAENRVTAEAIQKIKRRRYLVIRQNFPRDTALAWDKSIRDYLDLNHFDDVYQNAGDNYFGSLETSRPEIYPIYWSQAQMQARQSEAIAYILLRPLLKDVPEDELCGVAPSKALPTSEKWHPHLARGLCSIPSLQAGDSVWWHCDLIHSVAPVENQQGWGNVMYIPAAPRCDRNLMYAHKVAESLKNGTSPADFAREDYEKNWEHRFTAAELNSIGLRGLGSS
ncbi:YbiU family protein [Xenorhabdus littoralis]|uniref:YbiU family protein n=1 Tax=Xenorhabdus littoralis TaxID=2582835 RepID=UPI0029E7E579|nr:YbiU family protein [Xenorhabdus sp. psl]MDX7990877.1 DUF1479 family protein [Xenorhabdus sp. psl]